jgi:tRNA (mo5U34)-methyltransferase
MMPINLPKRFVEMGEEDPGSAIEKMMEQKWFHQFDFGEWKTPGYDPTEAKLKALQLHEDLSGKSVLDIGACDGFFSFECEKRGASYVMAVDNNPSWVDPQEGSWKNFRLVRTLLRSNVFEAKLSVLDPFFATDLNQVDIVLFLGVLYHLSDPLQALKNIRPLVKEYMILETLVDCLDVNRAAAAYYPGASLGGDGTNNWGPNVPCLNGLLQDAGFTKVDFKGMWHTNTAHPDNPVPVKSGRMVFHVFP